MTMLSTSWVRLLLLGAVLAASHAYVDHRARMDPVGYSYQVRGIDPLEDEMPREKTPSSPRVTLPGLGSTVGRTMKTLFQRDFAAFHSLPYAHQPKRFKYSTLWDDTPWEEVKEGKVHKVREWDATYFRDRCPQHSMVAPVISGKEDCLHISIYTPLKNFTDAEVAKLPVMVFIHGGAYMTGEATLYMPSKLLDKDVVVAVMQYRLGTLGFLYSETFDAPGNMGLMDQVIALRWVNKYISYFGGDPGLVTLFGQSAGGASTSLLQLSELIQPKYNAGKQLVHHFLPMSGSSLEYWTLGHDTAKDFAIQTSAADCESDNATEAVQCLSSLPLDDVVTASLKAYQENRVAGGLGFDGQVPVVQTALRFAPDRNGTELVLIWDPLVAFARGDVVTEAPTMLGAVRDEGSLVVGLLYNDYLVPNNLTNDTNFLTNELFSMVSTAFGIKDDNRGVANSFRLGFLPDKMELGVWDQMVGGLVDLSGTLFLKSGVWSQAYELQKLNASNKVFFYSFEYPSDDGLFEWIFMKHPDLPVHGGIGHGDDLMYLFNLPCYFDEREKEMVKKMTTIYTNFAKYGTPTPLEEAGVPGQWTDWSPEWEPYTPLNKKLMVLADNFTMATDFPTRWNYNKFGYVSDEPSIPTPAVQNMRLAAPAAQGGASVQYGLVGGAAVAVLAMVAVVGIVMAKRSRSSRQGVDNMAMVET